MKDKERDQNKGWKTTTKKNFNQESCFLHLARDSIEQWLNKFFFVTKTLEFITEPDPGHQVHLHNLNSILINSHNSEMFIFLKCTHF